MPARLSRGKFAQCREQSVHFFRESLRRELFMRYLEQQKLEDHITGQFDNDFQEVDVFAVVERGLR